MNCSMCFPKKEGFVAFPDEMTFFFNGANSACISYKNSLNTAFGIAKLYFCLNVPGECYDYFVTDVFTDNNGYNNSLCLACTTSVYCNSGLAGFYGNNNNCTLVRTVTFCYSFPVRRVFAVVEKIGAGNIVYNVVNPVNNCRIACNLCLNCLVCLQCCLSCLAYEFVQCGGACSCFRSYSVGVIV